jgi:hypothetical protein
VADALIQWRVANAGLIVGAQQKAEKTPAEAAREIARLQMPQSSPLLPAPNATAAEKALVVERTAANRELQLVLLQTRDASPQERQAALDRWREKHDSKLGKLASASADEAKAREAALRARSSSSRTQTDAAASAPKGSAGVPAPVSQPSL